MNDTPIAVGQSFYWHAPKWHDQHSQYVVITEVIDAREFWAEGDNKGVEFTVYDYELEEAQS